VTDNDAIACVRTVAALRHRLRDWREDGLSVGLVPTMGGLHAGHMALVRSSLSQTDHTAVTLFVNPKQFGAGEDLDTYPQDETVDSALLAGAGAHLLFAPAGDEIYREGHATAVRVSGVGEILEEQFRPGFFEGVATVVTKLLLQALPNKAFFGEKDYQQLQVVRRLTADLNIPVEIVAVPTVREEDGLALSSRNAYLDEDERRAAPALYQTIRAAAEKVAAGEDPAGAEAWGRDALEKAGFDPVDYVAVRDAETLLDSRFPGRPARVLAAARLGRARLIDNVPV